MFIDPKDVGVLLGASGDATICMEKILSHYMDFPFPANRTVLDEAFDTLKSIGDKLDEVVGHILDREMES